MVYVYILSTYGEYGAENVKATLDRTKLEALLSSYKFPSCVEGEFYTADAEDLAGLKKLLENSTDAELAANDGQDLCDGWGGYQLHVVELY